MLLATTQVEDFDKFMAVPWPQTLLGTYVAPTFPILKMIPSL